MTPTIDTLQTNKDWIQKSKAEDLFSSDEVINAYLKGKSEGFELQKKILLNKLTENINQATTATNQVIKFLKKNKFNSISAHLKINSFTDLSVLIMILEEDFLDSKMLEVYNFIAQLETNNDDGMYNLEFSFCDRNKSDFDENKLITDGYLLKHKKIG